MKRPVSPEDTGTAAGGSPRTGVAARFVALHARPVFGTGRRGSMKVWILVSAGIAVVLAVAFALVSVHYDDTVLSPVACPAPASVNAPLGTILGKVSGLQFSDFHSCSYAQGTDTSALEIDVAIPNNPSGAFGPDRCRSRRHLTVAGDTACSMAGTPGTTRGRPSLLIETRQGDWQFTTNLASVSMTQLETLAKALLNSPRRPFA